MINARTLRSPSAHTASLVRVSAFLVAAASAVLIPVEVWSAASGHTSAPAAFEVSAAFALVTLVMTLAVRSLDPLRR